MGLEGKYLKKKGRNLLQLLIKIKIGLAWSTYKNVIVRFYLSYTYDMIN